MANKEVKLKDGNDYLFPQAMLNGIDTENILYNQTLSVEQAYQATEDCICIISYRFRPAGIFVDNVKISSEAFTQGDAIFSLALKKGQTLKITDTNEHGIKAFGIKH